MSARQLAAALRIAANWAEWEAESLDDFHAYAQKFLYPPGGNVFQMVLEDALRYRGLTLDQFRAAQPEVRR